MRQIILKQAFEGKLISQDPNDEHASILLNRIKQKDIFQITDKKIKSKK